MTMLPDHPGAGSVPNDPDLIARAVGAYQRAAGAGAPQPDRRRTYHARHADGRDYVLILDGDGDLLTAYVRRGDGRLKIARQIPDGLPEATESRVTETAPGQYASAVRLRGGDWVTALSTFTHPDEARRWARDTADADGYAIADRIDVRPARSDAPCRVYVEPVKVPRYAATLEWPDGRWWQCDHGHTTPQDADACARHAAADPAIEPRPPVPVVVRPGQPARKPGPPVIAGW